MHSTPDIDRKNMWKLPKCAWWDKILVSSRVSLGVEMRVVVVLALLFCGISHEVEGGRATSISKEEDLELERELRRLNKPAIKSFQTEYGDIFDCVDINKQPALDHPLLKNHRVQKKPSVFPKGLGPKTSAKTLSSKIGLPDGGCPEGTVPIKRITKRDLIWMKSQKRNTTKFHPMDGNTPGYHQIYTRQKPGNYYGAQGGLSLHSEPAANGQNHRATMTASGGPPDRLNVIQVGWMVNKDAYGDGATRMFTFWTADNFVNTGCRDLFCPGFVQLDPSVAPGMTFYNLSTVDGPQYDYNFVILEMNATDENWWFLNGMTTIGYWPKALFTDINESFTNIEWGGYLYNNNPKNMTSPPMGSGRFPEEQFGKAAYFRDIQLMEGPPLGFELVDPDEVELFSDNQQCYGVGSKADFPGGSVSYNFYYGGPGGDCNP